MSCAGAGGGRPPDGAAPTRWRRPHPRYSVLVVGICEGRCDGRELSPASCSCVESTSDCWARARRRPSSMPPSPLEHPNQCCSAPAAARTAMSMVAVVWVKSRIAAWNPGAKTDEPRVSLSSTKEVTFVGWLPSSPACPSRGWPHGRHNVCGGASNRSGRRGGSNSNIRSPS